MRVISGLAGALVVAALALVDGSDAAGAATLKADYQLQDSRTSQLAGAPDLVDLGQGNRFKTEAVGGVARQVLAFPKGGGVSLRTAGLVDPTSHSIVMVFRLAQVFGFRRLLDFSGGGSDRGLYDLDKQLVLYPAAVGPGDEVLTAGSYVQVALTTETTLAGSQWSVAYVNGSPVTATTHGFSLRSGVLRFFQDNVRGGAGGEESAGALACVLVYDGALSTDEIRHQAADPALCPAPRPAPSPRLGFKTGTYRGTTSQGLPISFAVGPSRIEAISFRWRARCADGRVHTNGIFLEGTRIRDRRFSVRAVLSTGGRARVSGRLSGGRARGRLSRWANSAFDTVCVARGIRWHAHVAQGRTQPY